MFALLLRLAKVAKAKIKFVASKSVKNLKKAFSPKYQLRQLKKRVTETQKLLTRNGVKKKLLSYKPKRTQASKARRIIVKRAKSSQLNLSNGDRIDQIARVANKSRLIENMQQDVSSTLRGKSSANIQVDETVKGINKNTRTLMATTDEELDLIEKTLNKELKRLNIDTDQIDNIDSKQYEEIVKKNSFDAFMDNWKSKFFDSDTTEHMSEAEKEDIWMQIEEDHTYEKWQASKYKN